MNYVIFDNYLTVIKNRYIICSDIMIIILKKNNFIIIQNFMHLKSSYNLSSTEIISEILEMMKFRSAHKNNEVVLLELLFKNNLK